MILKRRGLANINIRYDIEADRACNLFLGLLEYDAEIFLNGWWRSLDLILLSKFIISALMKRGFDHAQPPEWNLSASRKLHRLNKLIAGILLIRKIKCGAWSIDLKTRRRRRVCAASRVHRR